MIVFAFLFCFVRSEFKSILSVVFFFKEKVFDKPKKQLELKIKGIINIPKVLANNSGSILIILVDNLYLSIHWGITLLIKILHLGKVTVLKTEVFPEKDNSQELKNGNRYECLFCSSLIQRYWDTKKNLMDCA